MWTSENFFFQSDTTGTGRPPSSSGHSCQSRRKQARAKEKGRFYNNVDSSTLTEQPGSSILVNLTFFRVIQLQNMYFSYRNIYLCTTCIKYSISCTLCKKVLKMILIHVWDKWNSIVELLCCMEQHWLVMYLCCYLHRGWWRSDRKQIRSQPCLFSVLARSSST